MEDFTLTSQERQLLVEFVAQEAFSNEARRAQGLLWIDAGDSPQAVAKRLRTSRQTVYNWATRFKRRNGRDLKVRLADGQRSGRPCTVALRIEPMLSQALGQSPRRFGYEREKWNAALLGRYLRDVHHVMANISSINAVLRRLEKNGKLPLPPVKEKLALVR
ncbi:MAG: transposase [Candidatus Binatia bacterium]